MRFKVFGPLKCLLNINKLFKLTKGYIRELLSLSLIDSSEYWKITYCIKVKYLAT